MNLTYFSALLFSIVLLSSCSRAKEADFDGDQTPDILVKGNKFKDLDELDNVLIVDDIIVNGVTHQQWTFENGEFHLLEEKTFKMEYDSQTEEWRKIEF